jgi:tetratricopeptide (TPR) repeat protein
MIDPEAITEARRALGRQLAACREAAGLKQQELAPQIHYGRSTIANAEAGRSTCSAAFWERCDEALRAQGALLRAYNEFKALVRQQQAEVARLMETRRNTQFRRIQAQATTLEAGSATEQPAALWSPGALLMPEAGTDMVTMRLQLEGREVVVPFNRRALMQAGVGTLLESFALGQQFDKAGEPGEDPGPTDRVTVASPTHLHEIVVHLREQWHALVKTDNLLGPRFALAGVLNQITVVQALLSVLRDAARPEVVQLGAQYAESAAWLYEDSGNLAQSRYWTSRAMEWAYEANDTSMLAWTIFRRSQQAAAAHDAAQVIGLAQAARRDEERLAPPMRAAIRVQEAYGHALDGNEQVSQQLLDEAHTWAASDTAGDARAGHGSYCTASYIEIHRAECWLTLGRPRTAIRLYQQALPALPAVYQRDRAAALGRLAAAYVADGELEQAASTAHAALPVARGAGSRRIVGEIKGVSAELAPYRPLPAVAALLDDLEHGDA